MSEPLLRLTQTWNDRATIAAANSCESASYRFKSSLPKACFHPLTTAAGHVLTGFEMSDHVWHRGLWFAIKFVNGTNFWEENAPFGIQQSVTQPSCEFRSAGEVSTMHQLDWTSAETGTILREARLMNYRSHPSGFSSIEWNSELTATADLLLDRTPYTTWGGYGGLSFRASRELHDASFLLPDGSTVASLAGESHDWVMMNAAVDGGAGERISFGMIDHPDNPRSPSPWYCKSGNGFNYMNAAFLFQEPLAVSKDKSLRFKYRVVYRDGVWTAKEFQALADEFRENGKALCQSL